MRIAVYCSARTDLPEIVKNDARRFGEWIGRNHHTLVYGGLSNGLMEIVARSARDNGAEVIGIVPESRAGKQNPANTMSIRCESLHERKQLMEENADAFVALDGGFGTLDEIFSALATMIFFNTEKPIMMLNRDDLYSPLQTLIRNLVDRGLASPGNAGRLQLHPDLDSIIDCLSDIPSLL